MNLKDSTGEKRMVICRRKKKEEKIGVRQP